MRFETAFIAVGGDGHVAGIAYQGERGSYSEEAVWNRFGGQRHTPLACHTFEESCQAVVEGRAQRAVLPIENTVSGAVVEAVAAIEAAGLEILDRFWVRIDHCLVGQRGARRHDIERVYSQPEALEQCRHYLAGQGFTPVPTEDTAGAVREVRERGHVQEAAIASRRAAALHHMEILDRNIQDHRDNRTRFAVVTRPGPVARPSPDPASTPDPGPTRSPTRPPA